MSRFEKGRLVKALRGRDAGTIYVVIEVLGDRLCLVDGKRHTLANPKLKNTKHVQYIGTMIDIKDSDDVRIKRKILEAQS